MRLEFSDQILQKCQTREQKSAKLRQTVLILLAKLHSKIIQDVGRKTCVNLAGLE
jgi:hypothetical protein